MDRFWAAAQVAAFFLLVLSISPIAHACEDCERVPHGKPAGRIDVTAAVDAASSFVMKTLRSLYPTYEVAVLEGDAIDSMTVAEYAAAYAGRDGQSSVKLPAFRHRYAWQLTYRDEQAAPTSQPTPAERGTDATLDDSKVVGLRFEVDYGWRR